VGEASLVEAGPEGLGQLLQPVEQRERLPLAHEGLQPVAFDDLCQRGVVAASLPALTAAAEARASRLEDQASHPVRSTKAEAEGHARSQRVAGDVHPLQPVGVEEGQQLLQGAFERGVRGDGALPVPRQVRARAPGTASPAAGGGGSRRRDSR
jgi:hypothetical protein